MPEISYDFHIHSCLSPCGDDDMTPANIAGMAFLNNLDVIALTDHNTCKNCPAIMKKAEEYGISLDEKALNRFDLYAKLLVETVKENTGMTMPIRKGVATGVNEICLHVIPEDEEFGVDSYTHLWGMKKAVSEEIFSIKSILGLAVTVIFATAVFPVFYNGYAIRYGILLVLLSVALILRHKIVKYLRDTINNKFFIMYKMLYINHGQEICIFYHFKHSDSGGNALFCRD